MHAKSYHGKKVEQTLCHSNRLAVQGRVRDCCWATPTVGEPKISTPTLKLILMLRDVGTRFRWSVTATITGVYRYRSKWSSSVIMVNSTTNIGRSAWQDPIPRNVSGQVVTAST